MGKISMPFIRTGVGVQTPRWPFVMNGGSAQAQGLLVWYPLHPVAPTAVLDLSASPPTRDLQYLTGGFAPEPRENIFGGPSMYFLTADTLQFDGAEVAELNDDRPICLSGWFQTISLAFRNTGIAIIDPTSNTKYCTIADRSDILGNPVQAFHADFGSGTFASAEGTTDLNDRDPHFLMGKFPALDDTRVYLDGVLDGSDATVHGVRSGIDRFSVGRLPRLTPFNTGEGTWWDLRIYAEDVPDQVVQQMFEPDTRYELFDEYGQKTYFFMPPPNIPHYFPIPYIKRNVGVQAPRWPFVMNEGSEQAKGLFAWYPMHPVSPDLVLDLVPSAPKLDMLYTAGSERPTPDTHLLGGPSMRFVTTDFLRHAAGSPIPGLNDGRAICLSGWFETINLAASNRGLWILDESQANGFLYIGHRPDVGGNPARVVHGAFGGSEAIADGATDLNDKNPHFVMGKFLDVDDTRVYLDGLQDGSSATVHGTRSGVDRIGMGKINKVTPLNTGDGRWWDARVYIEDVPDEVIQQMFEPDTRYDLYEEYGQITYIDLGGQPQPDPASTIFQPMMTITNL